jgi:hypothetical protein
VKAATLVVRRSLMKSFISVESTASVPKTGTRFQDQMWQKKAYQMQIGGGIDRSKAARAVQSLYG